MSSKKFQVVNESTVYINDTVYVESIEPGYFEFDLQTPHGPRLRRQPFETRDLLDFENSPANAIIKEAEHFWTLKDAYKARGETHKRGYLLYGPPGSGKTSLIAQLIAKFLASGGMVFDYEDGVDKMIQHIQDIPAHADQRFMVLLEDLDNYYQNDEDLLQFLDGAIQIHNLLVIATTNYPQKIEPRIINRPSRFDRVMEIGMPSAAQRESYIREKAQNQMSNAQINKMVLDTEGMSMAHIKELLLATELYGLDYECTLKRLTVLPDFSKYEED